MKGFLERIREGVIVADGAMGTQLYERGAQHDLPGDLANLTHPHLVEALHGEYLEAGSEQIETNTFNANRERLASSRREQQVREINLAGVEIALRAAAGKAYVAGAVGPLGRTLEPVGTLSRTEAEEIFREQMEPLVSGGVDLLLLETFPDIEELLLAIRVALDYGLPVVAQKAFVESGETLSRGLPRSTARRLIEAGASVVGSNCVVGPQRMALIVEEMAGVEGALVSAQPTAGLPHYSGGRILYHASPEYFARYGKVLAESGARIVGGCCGTSPGHIRALAETLRDLREPANPPAPTAAVEKKKKEPPPKPAPPPSRLAQKLGKEFVVTVELDTPKGVELSKMVEAARGMKETGIDAVNVSDGARARLRMSPVIIAYKIQAEAGVEVVMHFTCRDRNLLGIQSELLGAHVLGIRNVLAITGDPAHIGDYPTATSVFDVDSIGLVQILHRFNEGVDLVGNNIGQHTAFLIGVALNPLAPDLALEEERLRRKKEEGAMVVFTQPVYDEAVLEKALEMAAPLGLPVLAGILPLRSTRHAEFLHNEVPGISIPEKLRKGIASLPKEAASCYGVERATEFLRRARPLVSGAYLMPPFGKYDVVRKIIEDSL